MKLSIKGFGLGVGLTWGIFTAFGAIAAHFGWSSHFVEVMSDTYPGYGAGFGGALIGAFWGTIHGCIKGGLVAWINNMFVCCKD